MEKNSGYVINMKVAAVLAVVFVTLIGSFAITKETKQRWFLLNPILSFSAKKE